MFDRIVHYWVYGGALAGVMLLALMPLLTRGWSLALLLIFLQLPVYMLHQLEEHDDDRFGRFVNATLGNGKVVLVQRAIFIINVPGVWGVNVGSIWLAATAGVGFGLIGVYLTLVNALVHIGPALAMRRYNPGLATGIVLFLPVGIAAWWAVQATGTVSWQQHALGLGLAIVIHAAIVAYVMGNRRRLAGKRQ